MPFAAFSETIRIATYNVDLDRTGPGLLVKDLADPDAAQIGALVRVLVALDADVVLLTAIDYDHDRVALKLLAQRLAAAGAEFPYQFAARPNTGLQTGLDLDGDGQIGQPRDAQGFGLFSGQGGMAVLSRLPIKEDRFRDFSPFLWRDLPDAMIPSETPAEIRAIQRLSTTAHWDLPVELPDGRLLNLLAWHASPPVFDGPEDRNGRRNHDEAAFWRLMLEGKLSIPPPDGDFVIFGDANLDPADGEGRREGITALLSHPSLQDPKPKGSHGRREPDHSGDSALDTALYEDIGGLRLDLVLPSAALRVVGSGVLWPKEDDPLAADLALASRHRPVWVDISLP
jgi:hypothetical protein